VSATLIVRSRVRKRALEVAGEWQLQRTRIPQELLQVLEEDFNKQITVRVMAMLGSNPRVRSPRLAKPQIKEQPSPKTPRKADRAAKQS
jgi:hypothetical protein